MRILSQLSTTSTVFLPIDNVIATEILQKRRPDEMHPVDRDKDRKARDALIKDIKGSLENDPEFHSTPLKAVRCHQVDNGDVLGFEIDTSEGIYLVDGYHRLEAYRQAGRAKVPVHVVEGTWAEAEDAATVFNRHTQTVPVDANQKRQQAWELVLRHHDLEAGKFLHGWSARSVGRTLGVNHETINNMVRKYTELGKGASSLTWKQARSEYIPTEVSELDRIRHIVKQTLTTIEKYDPSTVSVMLRVLRDYHDDAIGHDVDVDTYAEKLLCSFESDEGF